MHDSPTMPFMYGYVFDSSFCDRVRHITSLRAYAFVPFVNAGEFWDGPLAHDNHKYTYNYI